MSNTAAKVNSFIYLGYSILASQSNTENNIVPAEDKADSTEIPSYQDTLQENVLPDTQQVLQTVIPINPTILRI